MKNGLPKPPAYQWYVRQWLSSPTRLMMCKAARSAYRDLLDYCWDGGGKLPDDQEQLRILADCTVKEWKLFSDQILKNFFTISPGFITNRFLLKQWKERKKYKQQAVTRGKSGAKARWSKHAHSIVGDGSASSTASASASVNLKTKATPPAFVIPEWVPGDAWKGYEEMRRRIGKPMTDRARRIAVSKLADLQTNGDTATAVLEQSIFNSWQGLFPIRRDSGRNQSAEDRIKQNCRNSGLDPKVFN